MTTIHSTERTTAGTIEPFPLDQAEMAAVAFLARYSGRTLDGLAVLGANRFHLEMYRSSMEERGLAA